MRCQKESSSPSLLSELSQLYCVEIFASICQLIKAEFSKDGIIVLKTNYYDLSSSAVVMIL